MKVKWLKPETETMRRKRERLSKRSTQGATCSHPKERIDDKVMRVERPMIVGGDRKRVGIAVAADGAVPQHQLSNFHRNQQ